MHGRAYTIEVGACSKSEPVFCPRLHVCINFADVSDEDPPDDHLGALMRRIDELLGEAARLRNEAVTAGRSRSDHPFWPDRRQTNIPHDPDRRSRYQ